MPGFPAVSEWGVKLTPGVSSGDYFPKPFEPGDYRIIWPPPRDPSDGTLRRDGLYHVVIKWHMVSQTQFGRMSNLANSAQATLGGRVYLRHWDETVDTGSGNAGAYVERRGVADEPTYGYVRGHFYYDVEWTIRNLGIQ